MESQLPLFPQSSDRKILISDLIKIVSPGSVLRNAIDDIVRARLGALIVFYNDRVFETFEGGFKINSRLTQQKLVELCKMDGAIIISSDRKKILFANTLLVPDKNISTNETGTRHKAAERTAKQAETITIAVSERRNTVTVYYKELRYVLKKTEELISRATESLQILEKQKEVYDNLLSNLNVLEILGLATISEVASVLKRIAIIKKISERIERFTIELGVEGIVIRMRLKELTLGLEENERDLLLDYSHKNIKRTKSRLSELSFDDLVDLNKILKIISPDLAGGKVVPKGHRFLKKTSLSSEQIGQIVKTFGGLDEILSANKEKLSTVFGEEEIKQFITEREKLKEKILS